ncbi:hypothetical protein FRB95_006627 [Tulasnella sp. JGI-2019a]|nr:hypothetical protein FRB95_006627 [Tulasnella sp. JGI-2019a]
MPAIRDPRNFQLGAEFATGILIGIYSCILVVTLWRPIRTGRPLAIGWVIIAIYCLTLCRVAVGYRILGRTLFITGGKRETLDSTDYVLLGLRHGFSFGAPDLLSAAGGITLTLNGISVTLLFLQLDMFQRQRRNHECPLTTGATIEFARHESLSSLDCGEWSRPLVTRQRRASMPMSICQLRESATDAQASSHFRITFIQHKFDDLPFHDNSAATTVVTDKKD